MSSDNTDTVILKILSGVQAGVDVSLVDGTYILGSGDEADIQIYDVSLAPRHARLVVSRGRVTAEAVEGRLQLRSGPLLSPGDSPLPLAPLDLITAGTTRFTVAPMAADWSGIGWTSPAARVASLLRSTPNRIIALWHGYRAAIVLTVAGLLLLGFWLFPHGMMLITGSGQRPAIDHVQLVRDAIRPLDPHGRLKVRQDENGQIHVEGAIESSNERNLLVSTIRGTGVATATHLVVLQSLRDDIAAALEDEAETVRFTVTSNGMVMLEGRVADAQTAQSLLEKVRMAAGDAIMIRSALRTDDELLREIEQLAARVQIDKAVQVRLIDGLIEADGTVEIAQLDAWVGFLQTYARQYADLIPLRSLVRLRQENGDVAEVRPGDALYLGTEPAGSRRVIDMQKLNQGRYTPADLLLGADTVASRAPARQPSPVPQVPLTRTTRLAADRTPASRQTIDLAGVAAGGTPDKASDHPAELSQLAIDLLDLEKAGKLGQTDAGTRLKAAFDNPGARFSLEAYAQLLAASPSKPARACWTGAAVTLRNAAAALFWLDILTAESTASVANFSLSDRRVLAEAALNPLALSRCAEMLSDGKLSSLFLNRIFREPQLARQVLHDMPSAGIQLSGLSLSGERYFQTRDNLVFREGTAIDGGSSVVSIGELGVILATPTGLSVTFAGPDLLWQTQ